MTRCYSVKEISDMLSVNPETVRRWIRNGRLKASLYSRSSGSVVTENSLNKFLDKNPKYRDRKNDMNSLISWIRENRDVTVTVLFNSKIENPVIMMRYNAHPSWNYEHHICVDDEIDYIDVLNNMKDYILENLKPEREKEER